MPLINHCKPLRIGRRRRKYRGNADDARAAMERARPTQKRETAQVMAIKKALAWYASYYEHKRKAVTLPKLKFLELE